MQYAVYPIFPHSQTKAITLPVFLCMPVDAAVVATGQRHSGEVTVTMQIDLVAEGRNGCLMSSLSSYPVFFFSSIVM